MPKLALQGGGGLAFSELGSGLPLILLHGSPGEGRSWARVAPLLAERHRVIMPDLPGYGGSDPLQTSMADRTAAIGRTVCQLIELQNGQLHLCGHSYGGNVALYAAVRCHRKIEKLTLLEPVFFRALALNANTAAIDAATQFFSRYADRVTGTEPEAVRDMIDFWFGAGAFERMPSSVQAYLKTEGPRNGVDVRASLAEELTLDQLAMITQPTTVAYGASSPPVAATIARALIKLLPNAQIREIPGAHHGMLDTHPKVVAEMLI